MTHPNHTMQRMRAGRSAQSRSGSARRLARTADGGCSAYSGMNTRDLLIQLFSLLAVVLVTGCLGVKASKITRGNLQRIREGMTTAELVAILGKPTQIEASGSVRIR
jgi:hypothetical protein